MGDGGSTDRLDFFVSHAGADEDWATWLAQQLQNEGYTVELDVWNWAAGIDVIQLTQRALDRARRVLAVWSPEYFTRRWADLEQRVSFARAQVQPGWLLPVVVRACPEGAIPVLYRTLIRVELAGLPEAQARQRLLAAVAGPAPPTTRLSYPGPVYDLGPGAATPARAEPSTPAGMAPTQPGAHPGYPGELPAIWNVPNRNAFFVGRQAELAELAARLAAPGSAVAVVASAGAGGVGRTELAVEFAWRHAGQYRLVWWLDAGYQAGAEASLVELAALLEVPAAGGMAAVVLALRAELHRRADWLLIVDGVPDRQRLQCLVPAWSGRLLVTAEDGGVLGPDPPVTVGRFGRAESVRLLRHRCSWLGVPAARRIAAFVDDLPLSVAQAAQFLARTGMAADEYLPKLAGHLDPALDGLAADAGLAATVAVGQERLLALDPAAADLLDQFALLAAEPLPLTARTPEGLGEPALGPAAVELAARASAAAATPGFVIGDPETAGELVSSICGLGLAVRDGTQVQLQERVRALVAGTLTGPRRALVLARVLRLLSTADPGDPGQPASWPHYAAITPHLLAVTQCLERTGGAGEPAGFLRLLDCACDYLRLAGRAADSYELADAAHRRRRHAHGEDHPETLRWAAVRGAALAALGRHDDARLVLVAVLARQQEVAGADDPATLRCANQLAGTLLALGEYEAARLLLQDTLDRRRRTLGPDDPLTLRSAADLGTALGALGYQPQARDVLEGVYRSRRRLLGAGHVDTLACAHELGVVLESLGDRDAARGLLAEVVASRRATLGASHPDTLASAHRLGAVLAAAGEHAAAAELLDDTVHRRRATSGADHADTLACAHELGVVLRKAGEHQAASTVLGDVVTRRRVTAGADHPDTLESAHQLGAVLAALGDPAAARDMLADTAARRRRLLGPSHTDTLRTERVLGWR